MLNILLQTQNDVCQVDPNLFWGLMFNLAKFAVTNFFFWILTQMFFRM